MLTFVICIYVGLLLHRSSVPPMNDEFTHKIQVLIVHCTRSQEILDII